MSENEAGIKTPEHENPFRQDMLRKDTQKAFLHEKALPADYFLVDFLEEISDVVRIGSAFYTNSEAHRQTGMLDGLRYETLCILDAERTKLWESQCLAFIEKIKRHFSPERVILLRQKLCTMYGPRPETLKPFGNVNEIEKINGMLEHYYSFFEKHFPGILAIDSEAGNETYTYEFTKHGCLPQYYNGLQYKMVSDRIIARIENSRQA
jgi:hypothetical protein